METKITFIRANLQEVDTLLLLCRSAAQASGSDWSASYPDRETLEKDIADGSLYRICADGATAGIIAMNESGFLYGEPLPLPLKTAEIARFGLARDYQGKGLGKRALDAALERFRLLGFQCVRVMARPAFRRANDLYLKNGFRKTKTIRAHGLDFNEYILIY